VVLLKAKEGHEAKLEAAFAPAVKATRKEKGCVHYELNRDTQTAGRYLLYERWKCLADLEAHLKSAHIKTLLADLKDVTAGAPEARVMVPAAD
jgi:quinol monooxygenase YgiN